MRICSKLLTSLGKAFEKFREVTGGVMHKPVGDCFREYGSLLSTFIDLKEILRVDSAMVEGGVGPEY